MERLRGCADRCNQTRVIKGVSFIVHFCVIIFTVISMSVNNMFIAKVQVDGTNHSVDTRYGIFKQCKTLDEVETCDRYSGIPSGSKFSDSQRSSHNIYGCSHDIYGCSHDIYGCRHDIYGCSPDIYGCSQSGM